MKKRLKLFFTIATLCLSFAVFAFGVYSSIGITYKAAGLLNYQVESASVEIETRVFSTSKRYKNPEDLKVQAKLFENSDFETINAMTSLDENYTFNKVQIQNLDQAEGYEVKDSDFVDTYSSVANSEPPEDLALDLTYSTSNKVFTYFVVTKVTNKSIVPVYAYVPTEGEAMYVAPANSHMYKIDSYKEMEQIDDSVYIVFAMAIDDISVDIIDSPYVFPITITMDVNAIPEDSTITEDGPVMQIDADMVVPGDEVSVPTSAASAIKLTLPAPTIDMENQTSRTHVDFNLKQGKSLLKTSLYNDSDDYVDFMLDHIDDKYLVYDNLRRMMN